MPNFVQTVRLNKLPVLGIVPESSATAPTSPVVGQLWIDTSVTPKLFKVWDGSAWAINNIYAGTIAGSYTAGNDTRVANAEQTTNKNAANGYAGLDAGTKVVIGQIPTGQTGTTVPFGNDARFTDFRTPIDGSVTGGTAGAGVKIAATTITAANIAAATITDVQIAAANKDGVAGTASLRTLGTGAQQALVGNTNLSTLAAPTGNVALAGFKITGLGAPTANTDAARLVDVQGAAAGIDAQPSVRAASTANVAVSTGLVTGTVIDGVTLVTGDRVLLKNQTAGAENGTYIVPASGAASRTTDNISANTFWFAEEGTTQADTQWMVNTNNPITLGTTSLTIVQFGSGANYTGTANRITVTGTVIDIAATYAGQTSITSLGTITTGTWTGTSIAVANGGTGATTPATARTNLGAAQRGYAATLGAVTAGTPLVVTHNLGDQDVIAQVRDASTNEYLYLDVINASTNTVSITSGVAYAASALRISIVSVL